MRRVSHNLVKQPQSLTNTMAVQARSEIVDFLGRNPDELSTRRAPINERVYLNDEVRKALDELFRGKCAYCEDNPQSEIDIDHHRPPANAANKRKAFPHHYAWLVYDWENLLMVCGTCRRRKQTLFPLRGGRAPLLAELDQVRAQESPDLLDPGYDRPERHLDFTLDGTCHARTKRGASTISILELNRPVLLEGRSAVFEDFADRVRGAGSSEAILEIMQKAGDPDDPFAGAMLVLRNHYATALAVKRDHFSFPFDDTPGVLVRLHASADVGTLLDAFKELEQPRQVAVQSKVTPVASGWQGWSPPIRSVAIRNFKAIEKLDFELSSRKMDSSATSCLMLLGENATGKSSILEALTLALAGTDVSNTLGLRPRDYVRKVDDGSDPAAASVKVEFFDGPVAELIIEPGAERFEGTKQASANALAYGSRRIFLRGRRRRAKSGGIRGLFDPMWVLPHPDLWLRTLDEARFKDVARALREVLTLPDDAELLLDGDQGVIIKTGMHEVSIERHSDGYRSLFGTAVDIMHGMLGSAVDLREARGVVMIDEIETHLHPRWKLRVMSALRKALPQVQFVVTTHDPLCLRGMSNGEVQVMIRDADHNIERLEELPNVQGLRAEQLLTSDFFGLRSTADPDVELALAQQADAAGRGAPPTTLAAPLDQLIGIGQLGDTPQEQIAAEAMDAYLNSRTGGTSDERKEARRGAVAALQAALAAGPAGDAP